MNCADARQLILSADPVALRDRTDPVLREHLEACSECAAATSHVVGDVSRLRTALIARGSRAVVRPRRSNTKRVAMTLVPMALAAELAVFAFLGDRDNPNSLGARRPVIDDTVTSMLPAAPTETDTGDVWVAPQVARPKAVKLVALANDSAHDATDSTTRVSASADYVAADEMAQLQVAPASRGQRVAVFGTSNPKVTVVWLSKVDSL